MRVNKKTAILILSVFMLGMVAGCGGQKAGKQPAGETIKVGLNVELAGLAATYGTDARDGALLALEEINAAGGVLGKKLEPVVRDCKSTADEAMSVSAALAGEGVVAQIGPLTSGDVAGSTRVMLENKIPLIAPAATAVNVTVDEKTGKLKDYIFRACFIDPFQGTLMAEFAATDLQAKTAAIYKDSSTDYAKGLAEYFKKTFEAKGGTIVTEEGFVKDDREFRATLTKIRSKNPDFIYIPGYYQEVAPLIKQARELGITAPMGGADGWVSADMVKVAGKDNLNNTFLTSDFSAEDKDPKVAGFVKAFQSKHKKPPNSFNALGYDAMSLLAQAIKDAGEASPEKIKIALENIKDFQGVTGKMSIDKNHNPVKAGIILEYKDGVQVMRSKVQP